MTQFLGRRDCVESLRKDLIDLQGAILEVFSRTGPVRCPSWKFPDRLSCNLDLGSLLEQYDHVEGDHEFNQHSHIVLLELVIDRLLLVLQSFNLYTVQSVLRQTGDCLVELCQSEGLPSSLQPLLVAVEDTVELGHLTAGDLTQWAREQRRDMGRLGKHLKEVRGTVQPLADRLAVAEKEREKATSQVEKAQEDAKREMEKHRASKHQMELSLREAQRLKEELAAQLEKLNALECEKSGLVETVKALRKADEAHLKLQGRTQLLESQIADMQFHLNKESSKYQHACRQQEKSLVERMDALDQEREKLQNQLVESEERQSELQEQLKCLTEEKKQLMDQSAPQQVLLSVLCAELQREKDQLEAHMDELKSSVGRLNGEVQDLSHRERLLVAFPELSSVHQTQPQSTGNVIFDMEQQLQSNHIRIQVLEKENITLHNSLVKLKERYISTMGSSSGAAWLKHITRRGAGGGSGPESIAWWDSAATATTTRATTSTSSPPTPTSVSSSPPTPTSVSPSSPQLLLHGQTLQNKTGRGGGGSVKSKTYGQTRHASLARRAVANLRNK
ncbi:unnamed protein product [Merluccius merluccius]